jgi:hypothetical protein
MKTVGYVERVIESKIIGWAANERDPDGVLLQLFVDDHPLYETRASFYREDIYQKLGHPRSGFSFLLHHSLMSLLPPTGLLSVRAGNDQLPLVENCKSTFPNASAPNINGLLSAFADGLIISPKTGALIRPIGAMPGWQEEVLAAYSEARHHLKEATRYDLMIAYGTLLGWRRSGDFIPHDDDMDTMIVVDATDVDGYLAEVSKIITSLKSNGHEIAVLSSRQFHWTIGRCHIDVFFAWRRAARIDAMFLHYPTSNPDAMLPKPASFQGTDVLVPSNVDELLEATYGPKWMIPDPLFQYGPSPELKAVHLEIARAKGWTF